MAANDPPGSGASVGVPQPSVAGVVKTILDYLKDGRRFSTIKEDLTKQVRLLESICLKQQQRISELEVIAAAANKTNAVVKESPTAPSYASVAGRASDQLIKTKWVVRVYPSEPGTIASSEATKEVLKQVDIKDLNIGIKSMKSISKEGVVIECRNRLEACELRDAITDSSCGRRLKAELPEKQAPTCTMFLQGVDHNLDDIRKDMYTKNPNLFSGEYDAEFAHHWKTPNGNTIVVVTLLSSVYHRLAAQNFRIFLGWNATVRLRERDPITQCFRCQRFGHKAVNCKYQVGGHPATRCAQCSENHAPDGRCTAPARCPNCVQYNITASKRSWEQVNTGHSARDRNCPCRIRIIARARQQLVDYDLD